jgi:hypothetical protein
MQARSRRTQATPRPEESFRDGPAESKKMASEIPLSARVSTVSAGRRILLVRPARGELPPTEEGESKKAKGES